VASFRKKCGVRKSLLINDLRQQVSALRVVIFDKTGHVWTGVAAQDFALASSAVSRASACFVGC
jgi:hypothetical protein